MRIAFICNEYPPDTIGGIGTFVSLIAPELARRGHEVYVVGLAMQSEMAVRDGVTLMRIGRIRIPYLTWITERLRVYLELLKLHWKTPLDVVEVPDFQGFLPFPFPRCKVIVRLHLADSTIARMRGASVNPAVGAFEWLTLALHRKWVGPSQYSLQLTEDTFAVRPHSFSVAVLPVMMADLLENVDSIKHAQYILFAGTISERKGAVSLAKALSTVHREFPDIQVYFIGRAENPEIVSQIRELVDQHSRHLLHFPGPVGRDSLARYMKDARIFVFPSTLETFGLVVGEAMYLGTPVIACDSPPFTEFIEHGIDGLLVSPNNTEELARAIIQLLGDKTFSNALAASGQMRIHANYSLEMCILSTLRAYNGK